MQRKVLQSSIGPTCCRAAALSLLPLSQVQDVWMDVLNNSPDLPRLEQFNDTSPRHGWLMTPDFSYYYGTNGPTWDLGPTTILKGSTSWKNRIRKAHPNLFEFVTHIKKVVATDRARLVQVNHGGVPPKKRRIYRELDEHLVHLKDHLTTGRKSPMQYLDAIGHLIKLN